MAVIKIVVGSVYGNAQDVAEMCVATLKDLEHKVELCRNAELEDVLTPETQALLVCTSTTGQGEIPHNLESFYEQLQAQRPALGNLQYGLIALGDSSYDTFAEAGFLMDSILQELQAQRVGHNLVIDACETMAPLEEAEPWLQDWAAKL